MGKLNSAFNFIILKTSQIKYLLYHAFPGKEKSHTKASMISFDKCALVSRNCQNHNMTNIIRSYSVHTIIFWQAPINLVDEGMPTSNHMPKDGTLM